jgi:hypothetical protein
MPTFAHFASSPPLHARLRRLAWIVRALIAFGAIGLVAVMIWTWWVPEHALAHMKEVGSACNVKGLTPTAHVLGAVWSLLPLGVSLLGLQRLWHLFDEYGHGRVFSHRALSCLRDCARCILALSVLSPLYGAVMSVIATWANAPGTRQLNLNVSSDDYVMLLFGAVLLAISSVMAEAARVAEDNAGFV